MFMSGAAGYVRGLSDARVLMKPFNAREVVAMLKSCLPNDVQSDGNRNQTVV